MEASVHAIVLLGILLAGVLLLARLGGRVRSSSDLGKALLRAILTSIGAWRAQRETLMREARDGTS